MQFNQEDEKYKKSVIWSCAYMVLFAMLGILLIYGVSEKILIGVSIVGIIFIIINSFIVKYNRARLFINGLIQFVAVITLGVWVGKSIQLSEVVGMGAAISIMDILSFTRYGKHTTNAKAMSNIQFMSKLIVYGTGKGDTLYPTRGLGDFCYYSIWLAGIGSLGKGVIGYVVISMAIFIGTLCDCIIVNYLRKKETYKGFPATVIPYILVMLCYAYYYWI